MPRALLFGLLISLIAGCGGPATDGAGPKQPAAPGKTTAAPRRLQGASCKGGGGGNPHNIPDFVGIDVERRGGVERVTFLFRPEPGVDRPPSHYVKFSDQLFTGREGREAKIAGEFYVQVVFGARGVEILGEEPSPIYTGPTELKPGFGTIQEVEQLGDFEATITWGIGLSRRACFRVKAEADRLVIDFPAG